MVTPEFVNYFVTAAAAGGTLIGLLFVSVSIAPERTVQVRESRNIFIHPTSMPA